MHSLFLLSSIAGIVSFSLDDEEEQEERLLEDALETMF
jgi:hypothetical protein